MLRRTPRLEIETSIYWLVLFRQDEVCAEVRDNINSAPLNMNVQGVKK